MKTLLLFLFPLLAQARLVLKPGVYTDLKPSQALVLDTGAYTFRGLAMANLGKGVWLDARNARKITLVACRFQGTKHAVALLPGNATRIQKCTFEGFQTAIQVEPRSADSLVLEENVFENNGMALCTDGESLKLDMSGNVFLTDETQARTGVYLSPGANLAQPIGNDGKRMLDNRPPAGNLWPVSGLTPDTVPYLFLPLSVWVNRQAPPNGWRSLVNANPQAEVRYFAFDNEFVSGILPDGRVLVHQNHMPPFSYAYSPKDSTVAQTMGALGNWQEVKLPPDFSFPSKLWFSSDPGHRMRFELGQLDTHSRQIQLGQAVTDPETGYARIPIFIPQPLAGKGTLALRRQGSRQVVKTLPLEKAGRQEQSFSTASFEKGVYVYEIVLEGRSIGTRQWVFR